MFCDTTEPLAKVANELFAGGKSEVLIFVQFFIGTFINEGLPCYTVSRSAAQTNDICRRVGLARTR